MAGSRSESRSELKGPIQRYRYCARSTVAVEAAAIGAMRAENCRQRLVFMTLGTGRSKSAEFDDVERKSGSLVSWILGFPR